MRVELLVVLACATFGCAVPLDRDEDETPARAPTTEPLAGCDLLSGVVDELAGGVSEVALPDGRALLVAESVELEGDRTSSAFVLGGDRCASDATPLPARPIIDVSRHGDGKVGTPRAGFAADAAYLFFSLDAPGGSASEGAGIARYDEQTSAFVSLGLLWTADRPSYGSGAWVEGDYVYAYGGLSSGFLAADVYLARAPLALVGEPAVYEYFVGGGNWGPDADSAAPIAQGGYEPSVAWDPEAQRFVMAYVEPLAREIRLRVGLGPSGPWSYPVTLGGCILPFESAFCGRVTLLPSLSRDGGLALAQAIGTFDAPESATPRDFWPQLIRAPLPEGLP